MANLGELVCINEVVGGIIANTRKLRPCQLCLDNILSSKWRLLSSSSLSGLLLNLKNIIIKGQMKYYIYRGHFILLLPIGLPETRYILSLLMITRITEIFSIIFSTSLKYFIFLVLSVGGACHQCFLTKSTLESSKVSDKNDYQEILLNFYDFLVN